MNTNLEWVEETLIKVRQKMAYVSEKNQNKIPYTTDAEGNYDDKGDTSIDYEPTDGLDWWTNGFWGGIMWLLYQDTREESYKKIGESCGRRLEDTFRNYYGLHHDVGFMFMPTVVAEYKLTKEEDARRIGLHAANMLAGRFNPQGNFIRAWNELPEGFDTRGWAIIDCMFNITLLYWAYEETKDPRFYQIATKHADTVLEYFIRPDGSVRHIVEFDPFTGDYVKAYGGQGYDEESAWTRGQGWAVYGFVLSYLHTKDVRYLNAAKRVAHFCIANIPESGLLPVDFRQPKEPAWEDSCGACVIAGGLLEIAKVVPELEKELYYSNAIRILKAITEKRADFSEGCDAIVQNCTGAYHDSRHHFTMNYADYYYLEALYKLKNTGILIW